MTPTPIEEQRRRLLEAVALGFVVLMVPVAGLDIALWTGLAGGTMYAIDLVITIVMAGTVLGVRFLARRDQYDVGAWMLVCVLAARTVITVGIIVPERLASLAPGYLLVIVLAQVLIGARGGLIAGLGSLPMFALAYANGGPLIEDHFLAILSPSLLIYATVAGVVHMALQDMEQALTRQNVLLRENERARRELQDREKQSRAITESSPAGIVIQQDGHVVYANPRFAEMARCVQRDVFGLSLWDFFAPEDGEKLRAQLSSRREGAEGATRSDQVLFKPLRGAGIWCEVAAVDATYRDRPATVATILDVSERLRAQLQVQRERDFSSNIINTADAIIMALDASGRVVQFNPAGEQITGYTEAELKGRPFWEKLAHPEHREAAREMVADLSARRRRGHSEAVVITKAGEERVISWRYVAQINDKEGTVRGVIALGIDVTQQRLLEEQSIAAERLRALGQMAGGVAHDLNNTLAGILGPAELLMLDEGDDEKRRELSAIAAAARRGAATVKRIQRFSQARTDMDRQVFNLAELMDDVIQTLRPRWRDEAQREGTVINVRNELPPDLLVVGSSGEIGNVLTNLIVNACEAMPEGGSIEVSGHRAGDMTTFSVADTGVGMSEDMLEDIFQPFFSTKGADNSGLGLAVIRGIILRHGGSIDVSSEVGQGTTFTISLPAATGTEQQTAEGEGAIVQRGPLRVLVVDDSKPIANFAGTALEKLGHEATVMYDSTEALQVLRSNTFEVLLTDYGMEGLSGLSLAREAKRANGRIKTVIMTGWDFSPDEFEGIDAALEKPFTIGELKKLIDTQLPQG